MANSSSLIWLSLLGLLGGLAVMLYGVSLTAGESANPPMLAGGAIIVAAIMVLSFAAMQLEEPGDAHGGHDTAE